MLGPLETYLITWMRVVAARRGAVVGQEGYATQVVILTAALAALALAVAVIITTKVLSKANSINLNSSGG